MKPPSQAQIVANRRNALKSTGPRTVEGKTRSSRNAIRHGLCSAEAVVPGESEEEFADFRDQLWTSFQPANPMEDLLVERIVHSFWGLRRAGRVFNDLLDSVAQTRRQKHFVNSFRSGVPLEHELGFAFEGVHGATMDRVERHTVRLERTAYRALQALEKLRRCEIPLAVDASPQLGLFDDIDAPSRIADEVRETMKVTSIADLAKLPRVPGTRGTSPEPKPTS